MIAHPPQRFNALIFIKQYFFGLRLSFLCSNIISLCEITKYLALIKIALLLHPYDKFIDYCGCQMCLLLTTYILVGGVNFFVCISTCVLSFSCQATGITSNICVIKSLLDSGLMLFT